MARLTDYELRKNKEYQDFLNPPKKEKEKASKRSIDLANLLLPKADVGEQLEQKRKQNRLSKLKRKAESELTRKRLTGRGPKDISEMSVEELNALQTANRDEELAFLYKNNPNFDVDFPPIKGTKAREIWDRENSRRKTEKDAKIAQDYEDQADYLLDVPTQSQAAQGPLSNLRTKKFDPDDITPQGQVFNQIDYGKFVEEEAQKERERLEKEKLKEAQGEFDKRSSDEIKEGLLSKLATRSSRQTDNMGALDDRSSDSIKEGLLSNLNTRASRSMGMGGNLPETTSKQYAQRIMSQVGLNEEIEKAKTASMGRGTQSEVNRQRALRAGEVEDTGELKDKNRPGLSMEEIYENEFEMGKEEYDKEMAGDETLNSFGFNEAMAKEMELGRGTPRYRSIEEQDLEVDDALDAEGVPPGPERARIKEQLGNYFVDPVTGYAINLDKLDASVRTEAERKKMLSTANLLTGKARLEFMKNKGLISEKDIPPKTKAEIQKEQLDQLKVQVEMAEVLEKIKQPKRSKEQQDFYDLGVKAFEDENYGLAKKFFSKAGVKNMPDMDTKEQDEAYLNINGSKLMLGKYIGPEAGPKEVAKFLGDYHKEVGDTLDKMSGFKWADPGGMGLEMKTKFVNFFNQYGIPMWDDLGSEQFADRIEKDAQGNIIGFSMPDSAGNMVPFRNIPAGGWKNEKDYLASIQPYVFKRVMDTKTNGFHSEYTVDAPDRATLLRTGGDDDTGEEGAGGVQGGDFEQETSGGELPINPEQGMLSKALARENENVEPSPGAKSVQDYVQGKTLGKGLPDAIDFVKKTWDNRKLRPSEIVKQQRQQNQEPVAEQEQDAGGINIIPEVKASTDKGMTLMVRDANGNVDARQSTERTQNFFYTIDNEGSARLSPTEERYENKKLVKQNGKSVYHIGHGTKLPLTPEEVSLVRQSINLTDSQAKQLRSTKPNLDILKKIKITEDVADLLGKSRYRDHVAKLQKVNGTDFMNYDPRIRRVVFDMAYNLGPNFMTRKKDAFKDFRQALMRSPEDGGPDIKGMIEEIKDSTYFKSQNPNRAKKNIKILEELL